MLKTTLELPLRIPSCSIRSIMTCTMMTDVFVILLGVHYVMPMYNFKTSLQNI